MSESVRLAYHEAAHALVARSMGRQVSGVSVSPGGGICSQEAVGPDASDDELERGLVAVFAGQAAEAYAPPGVAARTAHQNGGDPWLTVGEFEAIARQDGGDGPSDQDVVDHYAERLGPERIERARTLAAHLVERKHATGQLEQLADELLWRGHLTREELDRLVPA